MQSVQALETQLADARSLLAEDQTRLGQLRVAKALDAMSEDDATELRTVRSRIRDCEDEVGDLLVALKVAEEFEASAAGQTRRAATVEAVRRVEAVGLALQQMAAVEDAAGAAYEKAMGQRAALQAAMRDQACNVLRLVQGETSDYEREAERLGHLAAAADGGIPQAVAFRLSRLAGNTRGMITVGAGVHFDAQARLTVAGAARVSLDGLLLRLAGILQAAGITPPKQGAKATVEHAATLVEAVESASAERGA